MRSHDKMQTAYELAFYPRRLKRAWNEIKRPHVADLVELGELLDMVLRLHQAQPKDCVGSPTAIKRLARHQLRSRIIGMERLLHNIHATTELPSTVNKTVVSAWMVRDICLPPQFRQAQ